MKTIRSGQQCRRHAGARFFNTARLRATAVVLTALSVCAATVGASPAKPVKNIVLVHGAFADGSSWAKVIPILQAKGYKVTAVQNPLTSFADDVAATKRALAQQDGPVILVGHSWAGVVITEAGMDPKVVGLVYVAAFAPGDARHPPDSRSTSGYREITEGPGRPAPRLRRGLSMSAAAQVFTGRGFGESFLGFQDVNGNGRGGGEPPGFDTVFSAAAGGVKE
jgi:pimeloyl-ACP methyl ester carboxylesterase